MIKKNMRYNDPVANKKCFIGLLKSKKTGSYELVYGESYFQVFNKAKYYKTFGYKLKWIKDDMKLTKKQLNLVSEIEHNKCY